jgi:hypothetical protein
VGRLSFYYWFYNNDQATPVNQSSNSTNTILIKGTFQNQVLIPNKEAAPIFNIAAASFILIRGIKIFPGY